MKNKKLSPLPREFYEREPTSVAIELLGKLLVRQTTAGLCSGFIVETEAYLASGDPACHAHRGQTRKNATMFGPAGHLYVYPIHSRHCMNVVTERAGSPSAVLLRAVEPVAGVAFMQSCRGRELLTELTRGPGRLCEAFAVDRKLDGHDLTRGKEIWIAENPSAPAQPWQMIVSPRIGVTSAHDLELRYFIAGNSFVSGRKRFSSS
jgi:DNA-3-methyladenine glycosylase